MANDLSYLIDDQTVDQFQNITTFVKNMTIKDSKKYDSAETSISKWFGDMLIKYVERELDDDDIKNLINFVELYNSNVDTLFDENDDYRKKVFGLYKTQDFNSSIINLIYLGFYNSLSDNKLKSDAETSRNKINYLIYNRIYYIIYNRIRDKYKINPDVNLDDKINLNDKNNNLNFQTFEIDITDIESLTSYLNSKSKDINSLINTFIAKEKIIKRTFESYNNEEIKEKKKASEFEKSLIGNGEYITFFDIRTKQAINLTDVQKRSALRVLSSDNGNTGVIYQYLILYKELNPEYRDVLDSLNVELNLNLNISLNETKKTNFDVMMDYKATNVNQYNTILTNSVVKYIRSIPSSEFLTRDFLENGIVKSTSCLYKYKYTNPYTIRRACESEVMSYYMGDDYVSNKYGQYSYERSEIYDFLKIYQETRDYYYQVLLNESFTNESEYFLYEKMFISFYAIERFLTGKLDNLKDVSRFNLTDIVNFFESYGFKELSDIIQDKKYYDPDLEMYSKNLIKGYLPLTQNKGSKAITSIIENIFSIDNKSLTIYRNLLVYDTEKGNYNFLRINENEDDNKIRAIDNGSAIELENFLANDPNKYWLSSNTPKETLLSLNAYTANTKYIIPEIIVNIAENYSKLRIIFAFIDYIFQSNGMEFMNASENGILGNYIDTDILKFQENIFTIVQAIRFLFNKYLSIRESASILLTDISFKISEEMLKQYSQFYTFSEIDETKTTKIKIEVNTNKIKNMFSKYDIYDYNASKNEENKNYSYKYIIDAFNNLKYLFLIDYIKNNKDITKSEKINIFNNSISISETEKMSINDLLNFENIILNIETLNLKPDVYEFLLNMRNSIFISETIKNILKSDNEENIESKIKDDFKNDLAGVKNGITSLLSVLNNYLDTMISLNIYSNVVGIIKFLKEVIEYFISYTTEIYNFEYSTAYETTMETVNINDELFVESGEISEQDSFFFDEKMTIEILDEGD